jgi:hypothetical protein
MPKDPLALPPDVMRRLGCAARDVFGERPARDWGRVDAHAGTGTGTRTAIVIPRRSADLSRSRTTVWTN